jgi:serine/threonine-protein kinase
MKIPARGFFKLRFGSGPGKLFIVPQRGCLPLTTSADNLTAGAQANRRFARLAVSWYALDAARVDAVLRAVERRHRLGDPIDFLDALREAGIINDEQRHSLRHDHAPTQIFVQSPAISPDGTPKWLLQSPSNGDGANANGDLKQMGRYRILRRLGQGGMGAVYLAFDSADNRQVAIKVLSAEQAPNQKILKRFQLEGQHGAMLEHPNIVRSYDMGQDAESGLYYIVLEFIDGPSAHELLDRIGKLQVGDAVHVILDIARALEHAHKNQIIHRDIKPGNILLTTSGLAKLSDLGLAKRQGDSSNLTHASQGIGTPYYMPYEQAMNAKMADERSDIYALGATLYHLVTGEVPFTGESSLEVVEKKGVGTYTPAHIVNPEVPERLDEVIATMLARDPDNRYQTISEVIVDLERSQLSAAIPSFINLNTALEDPVVVQRLTKPIEKTQPDLRIRQAIEENDAKERIIWFLRYRDQRGNLCKAKAPLVDILQRLRKGSIPPDGEAARSASGPFKLFAKWPEFQKTINTIKNTKPAAAPKEEVANGEKDQSVLTPGSRSDWWWLAAAAVLTVVVLGLAVATAVVYMLG